MERLKSAALPQDFEFRSTVLKFPHGEKDGKTDRRWRTRCLWRACGPRWTKRAETRTWRFLLIAVIRDAEGKFVDEMRTDVPFAVPDGQAKTMAGRYFTYAKNFSLSAGRYRITAAVMDRESGKADRRDERGGDGRERGRLSMSSL